MKIKNISIDLINPYINNPRKNTGAIDKVAESIREFGFKVPIVIDKNNIIVAGHTRLFAAKKLGLTEVPCIVADDLTDEQVKAFRLADNKVAEFAEWDMDALAVELAELEQAEFGMARFGFDENKTPVEDNFDVDKAIEEIETPVTKKGDVWLLGEHRLMCGDSTVLSDMERLVNDKNAKLILTDPPYNVNYGEKAVAIGSGNTSKILNDNMPSESFRAFLKDAFSNMFIVAEKGAAIYVFHSEHEGFNFRGALSDAGWNITQCIIWVKNAMVLGRQDYQWRHEPILYGWKPGAGHNWFGGRKQTTVIDDDDGVFIHEDNDGIKISINAGANPVILKVPSYEIISHGDDATTVWRVDKPTHNIDHPTMKPIVLCAQAIENSSQEGEIVLDAFGGSGSTLMACEQTNRICYAMELDEKYCDVIIRRWETFTGGKAVLENERAEAVSN